MKTERVLSITCEETIYKNQLSKGIWGLIMPNQSPKNHIRNVARKAKYILVFVEKFFQMAKEMLEEVFMT